MVTRVEDTLGALNDTLVLPVSKVGEQILYEVAGTYDMEIKLQEQAAPGSDAWRTLKTLPSPGGGFGALSDHIGTRKRGGEIRLIVTDYVSGSAQALLWDRSNNLVGGFGSEGPRFQVFEQGIKFIGGRNGPKPIIFPDVPFIEVSPETDVGVYCLLRSTSNTELQLPPATGSGDTYILVVSATLVFPAAYVVQTKGNDRFSGVARVYGTSFETFVDDGTANRVSLANAQKGTIMWMADIEPGVYITWLERTQPLVVAASPFSFV